MKKILLVIGLFTIFLSATTPVLAHPGRTDSSGGHTCRTNCPDWGLSYGEYHYHGGGYVAPPVQQYQAPATSTPKPTYKPLPTATPTPFRIATPTPQPVVQTQTTTSDSSDSDGETMGWLTLAALGGGGGYWLYKRATRKKKSEDTKPPEQIS